MVSKKIINALLTLENWLVKDILYYCSATQTYLVKCSNCEDNFEWNELPAIYLGLITGYKLSEKPHLAHIYKITDLTLYGYEHDLSLLSALKFAALHHRNQRRKSNDDPYINHIVEVVQIIKHYEPATDETTLIAAALHDVVEDTPVNLESISFLFTPQVASIVRELTCNSAANSDEKKSILLFQIQTGSNKTKIIKLADLISNIASLPSNWSTERKLKYVLWCKEVAALCSSESPLMYLRFNSLLS